MDIALIGNPNAGKTSLFNQLTGLNQKVGNFPGVTVDRKSGSLQLEAKRSVNIIDLPGTYSIYPRSLDEQVVFDYLNDALLKRSNVLVVVVVDASNLSRNLLLFTQIRDLGFPVILALNMMDTALRNGVHIDEEKLSRYLHVPVVSINARSGEGISKLKAALACPIQNAPESYLKPMELAGPTVKGIQEVLKIENEYLALLLAHQYKSLHSLSEIDKEKLQKINTETSFRSTFIQSQETIARFELISKVLGDAVSSTPQRADGHPLSRRIDKILLHPVWGYVVFFLLLFGLFQAVYVGAEAPMEWIGHLMSWLKEGIGKVLPEGAFRALLLDGVLAGLEGILVFIPQIAFLFAFIAILEESGYMSRVMFIMDKLMRPFGLNGKSVVPLVSGIACAVPAIMATRNIDSWKERLVTILVTPLMSCSARIPVFTVLIALVVPDGFLFGFLNYKGLVLMGLYFLGFIAALLTALALKFIIKPDIKSYFVLELPPYRIPKWENVGLTIYEKIKTFTFEAGKVILAVSIILWALASYGPKEKMEKARIEANRFAEQENMSPNVKADYVAGKALEHSYAGYFGRGIEPIIRPLGFDWKIGIALITSFAAREVFVGTMATIYSIASKAEEPESIIEKMSKERDPITGGPYFTLARACSLMVFYLLAMQCVSTLAVVYRETKTIKWPLIQFTYMSGLAYLASWLVYQTLA
jgi:ferrous iron transport protein B